GRAASWAHAVLCQTVSLRVRRYVEEGRAGGTKDPVSASRANCRAKGAAGLRRRGGGQGRTLGQARLYRDLQQRRRGDSLMLSRIAAQLHRNMELVGKLLGDLATGHTNVTNVRRPRERIGAGKVA